MFTQNDFWIPTHKWQLVEWLHKHYPLDMSNRIISWSKFTKKQLMAIYMQKRIKDERKSQSPRKITEENKSEISSRQLEFQF